MSFLDRLLSHTSKDSPAPQGAETSPPAPTVDEDGASYDRANWRKKLKSLLDRLPDSQPEWGDFMAEASALNFDPEWVNDCLKAEFEMLIRKVVSDRVVSPQEHQ